MANRRNTAARSTRGVNEDGRQLSFMVREPEAALPNDPSKLALRIPPPSSPVSAVRRRDLAEGRIVNVACLVGVYVNGDGQREILGFDVVTGEDGAGWLAFLRGLRGRGLKGVELVISDAHSGLKAAIASIDLPHIN